MRAALLLWLLALSGVATAGVPIEEKNVVSGKVRFDPAKGYIYLHGPQRQVGIFIRVPDQEDQDEHNKEWEKQFAKAQKRYPGQLERWRSELAVAKETKGKLPAKPIEPTRESFSIGPIEQRTQEAFGPSFVFSRDPANKFYSYLTAVKPGTYVWYGPIYLVPDSGYGGACYCMGSVKFEVKPGVVTDLGNFLLAAPFGEQESAQANDALNDPVAAAKAKEAWSKLQQALRYGLPASLNGWQGVQAEFSAAGKVDNFLGVAILRLAPIQGVLAYQRDTVIDVKTNTPVPTRAMVSWRSR